MRTNASREKTTGTVDPGFANGVGMANAENDLVTRENVCEWLPDFIA